MFKAIYSLDAERRWAVTGTPIQNRLGDLLSLFRFLRYHPFDTSRVFHQHVVEKWKADSDPVAIASLKVLVNSITLRRPKKAIRLPPRVDQTRCLTFTGEEREHYERTKIATLRKLDSLEQVSSTSSFVNALQWINGLRLICNHGLNHQPTSEINVAVEQSIISWNSVAAQNFFEQLCDMNLARCSLCMIDLSQAFNDVLEYVGNHHDHPWIAQSLRLLCTFCFSRNSGGHGFLPICNHLGRCCLTSGTSFDEYLLRQCQQIPLSLKSSTKVDALIEDLLSLPRGQKRYYISRVLTFDQY